MPAMNFPYLDWASLSGAHHVGLEQSTLEEYVVVGQRLFFVTISSSQPNILYM